MDRRLLKPRLAPDKLIISGAMNANSPAKVVDTVPVAFPELALYLNNASFVLADTALLQVACQPPMLVAGMLLMVTPFP